MKRDIVKVVLVKTKTNVSPSPQPYSWTCLYTMEQVNDIETYKSDSQNGTLDFNKA